MAAVSNLKNKSVIIAFVLGIIFAVFLAHAYMVYQTRALAVQNANDIAEIASFLQQATGQTPVAPAEEISSDPDEE